MLLNAPHVLKISSHPLLLMFHLSISGTLNVNINVSDFHNLIGIATKMYVPHVGFRNIKYRSFKHFHENAYIAH